MDITLTSWLVGVTAVTAFALFSIARREKRRAAAHEVQLARERGLGDAELLQLRHLTRFGPETSLTELVISPLRYDRAASAYVDDLRRQGHNASSYFAMIVELTRLRRRVHPSGSAFRAVVSTRDLPEAIDITAYIKDQPYEAMVWSVNDDHFDIRLEDTTVVERLEVGTPIDFELVRPGQGLYRFAAVIRTMATHARAVVRFGHTSALERQNRREFLRESSHTPILVTPAGATEPVAATLRDLSGGGLSFSVEEPIKAGTSVRVMLPLGESESPPRFLEAMVLRCEADPESGQYCAFGQWDAPNAIAREAIVKHVFTLQRKRVRAARAAARAAEAEARVLVLVPTSEP